MKKTIFIIAVMSLTLSACMSDLLEQLPPDQISTGMFWKTTNDATAAVSGVYNAMRSHFGTEYRFDSNTDLT